VPFFPFCSNTIWRCTSEKNPEAYSRCCGLPPRDCSTVGWYCQRSEKYVVPPCVLCRNYTVNKDIMTACHAVPPCTFRDAVLFKILQ